MIRRLADALKKQKIEFYENVPGSSLSTIRIGGPVALLVKPACEGELLLCVKLCAAMAVPYAVIGRGSNLLFADDPMPLAVILTERLDAIRRLSECRFYAQCGVPLMRLSLLAAGSGYADLAFACGIPGSLGGALYMNAGAYGGEMADVVESVEVYDLEYDKIKTYFNKELSFSYRKSRFQAEKCVILGATLCFKKQAEPCAVLTQMRCLNKKRRTMQPIGLPSAGSAFKRSDPQISVAKMIDGSGLRGYRIGGAQISEKHTGFIVNAGDATAADVKALIAFVQNKLEEKYGCRPDPEIRFLPEDI